MLSITSRYGNESNLIIETSFLQCVIDDALSQVARNAMFETTRANFEIARLRRFHPMDALLLPLLRGKKVVSLLVCAEAHSD